MTPLSPRYRLWWTRREFRLPAALCHGVREGRRWSDRRERPRSGGRGGVWPFPPSRAAHKAECSLGLLAHLEEARRDLSEEARERGIPQVSPRRSSGCPHALQRVRRELSATRRIGVEGDPLHRWSLLSA